MSGDKLINEILDSVWNRINNDKSDNEKNIKVIKFNKRYNYKTIEGKAVEHYIISDEKEISNSAVLSKNIL